MTSPTDPSTTAQERIREAAAQIVHGHYFNWAEHPIECKALAHEIEAELLAIRREALEEAEGIAKEVGAEYVRGLIRIRRLASPAPNPSTSAQEEPHG